MDRKDFPAFNEKPTVPVKYSGILQALSGENSYIEGGYNPIFNDISLNPARVTYEDVYVIPHENEHARQFNYPGDYNSQKAIDTSKKSPWYADLKKQGYSDSEIPYEVMAGLEAHRGQRNVKTGEAESSYEHSPHFARLPEDVKTWALGNKYDYQTNQDFLDNIDKYGYDNAMRIERVKHIAGNLKNKIKNFESGGAVNMNYPAQQSAQGLASLGRNNDTMLMHVTPREVAGLQSLAMSHGGSLTINPDTGLPEAGFFDSILTMGAGALLGGPVGLSALETGLLIGGTTLLATGDLGKAFGAGLGGYSGADLGKSFMGFANKSVMPGAPTTAEFNAVSNAPYTGAIGPTGQLGADLGFKAGPMGATDQLVQSVGGINTNIPNFGSAQGVQLTPRPVMNAANVDAANILNPKVPGMGVQNLDAFAARPDFSGSAINLEKFPTGLSSPSAKTGIDALTSGVSQAASSPAEFANYLGGGNTLKGTGRLALTGAGLFSDELIKPPPTNIYEDPEKGKWLSATGGLNLSDRFGNLNLAASGGAVEDDRIKSYALGGIVSNPSVGGGISDLYNRPEGQTTETISQDGYGIGRLNSLANAEAMTNAKTLGYAHGGYLDGQGDGMSDSIPATIEGKQPARLADGEFVVPADVVSHIGNGSSKAGSKRLYAMLDKVRQARTGHTKQGKQIKAEKYLPA